MIEDHIDAVGNDVDCLSLFDRRAAAVAQVLAEQSQGRNDGIAASPSSGARRH